VVRHVRTLKSIYVIVAAVATAGLTSAADNKCIQGTVIGFNGKPCEGAEVRALRVDGKVTLISATTDDRGVYVFRGLPVGAYSLTACVDGFPLSRANVKTQSQGWLKVDFDLRLDAGDSMDRMQRDLRGFVTIPNTNPH